ncbi:hypothetical protein [Candidatus Electrothrix sp.]|uniref:hypothetical protein n=1 Tax=Candidatus Electrothrix sp. TaxID=2170559 RepID=UPI004056B747
MFPFLDILTSFPLNRNAFGIRTAWDRPFLNIFAVSSITQLHFYIIDTYQYIPLVKKFNKGFKTIFFHFEQSSGGCDFSFFKDAYQIGKAKALFGKNIIVTVNTDWSTEDIVQASLDRWRVEKAFRSIWGRIWVVYGVGLRS